MIELILYALAGAIGALVKDIIENNKIQLPKKTNSEILLGTVGGMLIGAFVGYVIDKSILSAALSGFVGISAIEKLLPRKSE